MDKPISVGDLVVVVRPCCNDARRTPIFTVGKICPAPTIGFCASCGKESIKGTLVARVNDTQAAYPISWLKRLDPDALKDDVPTKEELTA